MTNPAASHWDQMYRKTPLQDVPRHFAGMRQSPFLLEYLKKVLALCPPGGRTCETGIGSGYGAIWLSLRGAEAEGIDYAPGIVERARQVNNILQGNASFFVGDMFDFYREDAPRYSVVHHQGVLEHFTGPQIQAVLAQQVALSDWVVFSVPSVYYPFEGEFGDERLLPLEEWGRILAPFQVEELRYYGDPQWGEKEHVLGVLRGQDVNPTLLALMHVPPEPYPDGISAIVHTRNEERHIEACLQTLAGWTSEIIVCDMESEDKTVEIARRFTDQIVSHPRIPHFDRARNVSAMRARYRWVLYLDADERVPPGLGPALTHLLATQADSFEGLLLPFRHFFAGHWMQCLYPGYTAPRVLKNGRFVFGSRLHSGAEVDGRVIRFPAENPDLALIHYSFDSVGHHLEKVNRYTDGEAASMHQDGRPFYWQMAIRHFVEDMQIYYDHMGAHRDGVHGFLYAFHSAFYRFEQHAKLFERRFHSGQLQPQEQAVPQSVRQMLEYALQALSEEPRPQPKAISVERSQEAAQVVWSGPLLDPSGYGEESRNFLLALEEAGVPIAAQILPWSKDVVDMPLPERKLLETASERSVQPGFIQIIQNFPGGFVRHPEAGIAIGRTMFETDRLPGDWVSACNRMDYVWVPSEFNRRTFADAGVAAEKLVVIPGCIDPAAYPLEGNTTPLSEEIRTGNRFTFLTVFDWTRHKGWDALLRAFLEAFEGRQDVQLVLKVWSTMGYTPQSLQEQARQYVQEQMGHDIASDPRIRFVTERLSRPDLLALYRASDAFVLPSRGEGWGRPYMEAMLLGLPTLGTNWSGNTAFMTEENSYLFDATVVDVPEVGWREISTYRGHRWAEPDLTDVKAQMRRVVEDREEAARIAARGREHVLAHFNRSVIGKRIAEEIAWIIPEPSARPAVEILDAVKGEPTTEPRRRGPRKAAAHRTASTRTVRWEGAVFSWHSLAHVNREIVLGLLASGQVELSLVPTEPNHFDPLQEPAFRSLAPLTFLPLSRPADIHIRHFFPPRLERPDEGKFVLIQPWEYGFLPARWIEPISENVDEVWCYSQAVKEVYLASGIAEEKLQVLPLGVDTGIFRPEAPPYVFTEEPGTAVLNADPRERFVFLFVGGTLHRKGIEILLEAYLKAFSSYDDVCLVIKDTGTETVYRGANERERILGLTTDATRPPILYIDRDLSAHQLAGVYSAADCLVQPYRGEGFCLPALEAMACGIPVIVPEGGPTDDFVDATVGWRVKAARKPFGNGKIGEWDCVGPTWMLEVDPRDLGRTMREAYQNREEVKRRGEAAVKRVQSGWTWQHTNARILERLEALHRKPLPQNTALPPTTAGTRQHNGKKRASGEIESPRIVDRRKSVVHQPAVRKMPTISLCMIVKDEERVLDACLTSVKPFVDEIVVVDTGSTDRTVEIAEAHGVKLHHFPWINDFSAARNVSLDLATGDWLFWMDADDTLPEECGKRLRELVLLAEEKVTGFLMQVHIPPAQGEHGFTIVDHVKLFRNLPQLRFEGRIHEQILEPIYRAGGTIERSNLYVVHSGYDYSPEGQKKKRERDLTILALDLEDRPDHPFVWFNIGMTAHHLKDWPKAVHALERCLELSQPQESTVRKVHAMLAGTYLEQGDRARAKAQVETGLERFPSDPELLFRAGIVYRELGDLAAAERSYLHLLSGREVGHIDSLDVSMTGFKAHHNLALIYQDMGRLSEAEQQWRAGLRLEPDFVPSLLGLAETGLRQGNRNIVLEVLARLQGVDPAEAERLRLRLAALPQAPA